MLRKDYKLEKHGVVDLVRMSMTEQKAFYLAVMERIIEFYKEEKK